MHGVSPREARLGAVGLALRSYLPLLRWAALLLLAGAAVVARLTFAGLTEYPGHADNAFYFVLARNLAHGRGFEIDYVWHYLAPPAALTHPSNDYWLPLAPLITSLSFRLLGDTILAATVPATLACLALSGLAYRWSLLHSPSALAASGAAALVLVEPNLFLASVGAGTAVYHALFVSLSLFLACRGGTDPRCFLLAAVSAGLAQLTRSDGVLLLPVLWAAILTAPGSWARRWTRVGLTLGAYLATITPWLVHNALTFGALRPPGLGKLMFLTDYEDLFSYAKDLSPSAYLAWGLPSILRSKLNAAVRNLQTLAGLLGLLWAPVVAGLVADAVSPERRAAWRLHLPPLGFLGLLVAFFTLVVTFAVAGFHASALTLVPYLLVLAAVAVTRFVRFRPVALLLVAVATAYLFQQCFETGTYLAFHDQTGRRLARLRTLIEREEPAGGGEVVIMTRDPWEVHHATGYRALQIPNDDLATILAVARRYGATHLLLPAPRAALAGLYRGEATDERFRLVGTIPGPHETPPLRLFRLRPP
jgi:hypothetical protein